MLKNREVGVEEQKKLSNKLAYGAADFYGGASGLIISILFMVFMTNTVHMPGWLASFRWWAKSGTPSLTR
jgi:Na+/melibiose symporter-like transporter